MQELSIDKFFSNDKQRSYDLLDGLSEESISIQIQNRETNKDYTYGNHQMVNEELQIVVQKQMVEELSQSDKIYQNSSEQMEQNQSQNVMKNSNSLQIISNGTTKDETKTISKNSQSPKKSGKISPKKSENSQKTSTSKTKKIGKYVKTKTTSQRKHLKNIRRKRGQIHELQRTVNGYWTKNILQYGKKPHMNSIKQFLNQLKSQERKLFLLKYQKIKPIMDKDGISLTDYEYIYKIEELKEVWEQFFKNKILYSRLMTSRVKLQYRKIFVKYLNRFEEAYKQGVFDHIV